MSFSSYLKMGLSYASEGDHFNAIISYELAISKQGKLLGGLNNIASSLICLGLEKQALHKLNRLIRYYESGKAADQPWIYYTNRAIMFERMKKPSLMIQDVEKALKLKKDWASAFELLGRFEILHCNFQKGIEYLSEAITYTKQKGNLFSKVIIAKPSLENVHIGS